MKYIFNLRIFILLSFSSIFFLTSCYKSKPDENINQVSGAGWAVGLMNGNQITILHTTNGGADWTNQTQLCTGFTDFQGISAASEDVAWAVGGKANGYGAVIRTKDKGENWCRVGKSTDIPDVVLYSVKAFDENVAWVTGENGTVLQTVDGGMTWLNPDLGGITDNIYSITQSGNNIWIGGGSGQTGVIMISTDGGKTFSGQGEGIISGKILDIQAFDQDQVIAASPHNIYLSTNSGAEWRSIYSLSSGEITDVCSPDSRNIWVTTSSNMILHSPDLGSSWSGISLPATGLMVNGITGMPDGRIYFVGKNSAGTSLVMYTADEGKTWNTGSNSANAMLTRISMVSGVK